MNSILTLKHVASHLQLDFKGDGDAVISRLAPIATASENELTYLEQSKYRKFLTQSKAAAIILKQADLAFCPTNAIISDNPHYHFAKVAELFLKPHDMPIGIHQTATIGQNCEIDESAAIGPYVCIGNNVKILAGTVIHPHCVIQDGCTIGQNTTLYSRVTLYPNVHLGNHSVIHSGTVLGSDGFGYAKTSHGWYKVPQLGGVIIGSFVEIGANSCVDRGAMVHTVIEDGVKIDNLVQIAHNVHIGKNTIIAGCVAIAGSSKIGANCLIAGGVGIADHVEICDNVIITGLSGVSKSLTQPGVYSGNIAAHSHDLWLKNNVHFQRLHEYAKRIQQLEKKLSDEKQ